MTHKDIDEIIDKYLKGEATSEEMEVIRSLEVFSESKIKGEAFESDEIKNEIKEGIFNRVQKEKNRTTLNIVTTTKKATKSYKLYHSDWVKYSAASVVIGLLGLAYMFKNNLSHFNSTVEFETNIVNVDSKVIEPGTNKATLTLQDGSVVLLEKDHVYQTKNVNSKGNNIVYNRATISSKKIDYNYLTVPRGGQFSITLSDGTVVSLNSETQIKYPVAFVDGTTREVELVYGEAYFDVSPSTEHKGAKFKVLNASQEIEVLGTEFNVSAYKGENTVQTTLVEGKVAVYFNGDSEYLTPNQQSSLDIVTNTMKVNEVNVADVTSWMHGVFIFRGTTLKKIMKVISRWYDVDIVFESQALESIPFKGVLGKNQNLEEILETIKTLSVIKTYEINGNKIKLK